jgi:capsular exopolysaccharide synthesis family protein
VDANFRRPAVHRFFPIKSSGGLSNILIGSGTVRDYLSTTDIPNMDVLGSGPMPPSPAELVSSPQMRDFIAEVTEMYDQVILDAPPVLLATDAALLASRTNGAIVVLRANANSRGIANRSFGMIRHVNAHLFGTILNATQIRRGGYFREQLRTFYDYRLDEDGDGQGRALPESDEVAAADEVDDEEKTT